MDNPTNVQYSKSDPRIFLLRRKWTYLIIVLLLGICCLSIWIIRPSLWFNFGPITVTDIRITTDVDASGTPPPPKNVIKPEEPRIYCFVAISSPKAVSIRVKWYWNGMLIHEDQSMVESWRAYYIEPLPGKIFPEGDYTVDIFLYERKVKSINFTVEQ